MNSNPSCFTLTERGILSHVAVEARFDDRGGQLASRYRATFSPPGE